VYVPDCKNDGRHAFLIACKKAEWVGQNAQVDDNFLHHLETIKNVAELHSLERERKSRNVGAVRMNSYPLNK
jgi:hypothetical protein